MTKKKKQPKTIIGALWREPVVRLLAAFIGVLFAIAIAVNLYTAYYVYEDGRCFWADCKIIKGEGWEVIQIGDD